MSDVALMLAPTIFGRSIGVSFENLWAETTGFLTGEFLGPMLLAIGGFFVAIVIAGLVLNLIHGRR